MSVRDIQKLSDDYIRFKIGDDAYVVSLIAQLTALRDNRHAMVRIAQALFYLPPESGEG